VNSQMPIQGNLVQHYDYVSGTSARPQSNQYVAEYNDCLYFNTHIHVTTRGVKAEETVGFITSNRT